MTRQLKRRLVLWLAPTTAVVVVLIASTHGACGAVPRRFNPVAAFQTVQTRLILIGDAGAPNLPRDAVLLAAAKDAARDPENTTVVWLGDNIYPRGLVRENDRERRIMERRLDAQIDVSLQSGASSIFVPGNHDWDAWGPGGWDAVRRQAGYIESKGQGRAELLPAEGCPGPVVRDIGPRLRVIVIDTQWWLHPYAKPRHPDSSCPTDSEPEVLDALNAAIGDAAGRFVVVAAHHPLATGGTHGGYFGWQDHIFPLRARKSWLWIPLPGVGSIYPWARRRGVSDQDMGGPLNRRMREALEGAFARTPPLVFAAGHDHNLQVISGKDVKYILVSGAGYFGHVSRAAWTNQTLFAAEASGYITIDVGLDGPPRLGVVTIDAGGTAREAYSRHLD